MALLEEITLPGQPGAGVTNYIPLGGNGFIAPQSAFIIDFRKTGDATGGATRLVVNRDPRFEHIIQTLSIESDNAATQPYRFDLFVTNDTAFHHVGTTSVSAVLTRLYNVQQWSPPQVIAPVKWQAAMDNIDGDVLRFKCIVYNFNIRASELIPLSEIFAALPRSPSSI